MTRPGLLGLLAFLILGLAPATSARAAYTYLYNNLVTPTGAAYENGGATSVGGVEATRLVADDITAGAGLGGNTVNQFSFTTANFDSVATTFSAILFFYASNGVGGDPGTLIAAVGLSPITLGAGSASIYTVTAPTGSSFFTMPTGLFWAGIVYTDGGTGSATAAQLNDLAQLTYSPPSVGSSLNLFFQSTGAGTGSNNPAGGLFNFGGTPQGSFGYSFSTLAIPEPSSAVLLGLGGVIWLGGRLARRPRAA